MKQAAPIMLWAAVVQQTRSEWIHYDTLRRTRKEAREAYLEPWEPDYREEALKRVRFARVVVSLAEPKGEQP